MGKENFDIDAFIEDLKRDLDAPVAPAAQKNKAENVAIPQEPVVQKKTSSKPQASKKKNRTLVEKLKMTVAKVALILLETVLLVVIALYGVLFVLAKGPSPTARDIMVMSVRETSAVGFIANIFFSDEEIALIEASKAVEEYVETDTSLITIQKNDENVEASDENEGPVADAWGLIDEDEDGIIIDPVHGDGYSGYMMVVLDPSRVIVGTVPSSYGECGYTVAEMVEMYDAVAGINGGGFVDTGGNGTGDIPDSMVVYEGKVYCEKRGPRDGFVGFDDNHILHVGKMTAEDIKEKNIQYGASFGPVLISNGVATKVTSGVNPRTAIGQRSDGAILMLVIDGRQVISLGATYQDLIRIFQEYGAVNACNLDGGSSTLMWYQGDYINNCASVVGIRTVPTTFLVMKKGGSANE